MRVLDAFPLFSVIFTLGACTEARAPLPPIATVAACAPSAPAPPNAVAICTVPDVGAGLAASPVDRAASDQLRDVYKTPAAIAGPR